MKDGWRHAEYTPEQEAEGRAIVHRESEGLTPAEIRMRYSSFWDGKDQVPFRGLPVATLDAWMELIFLMEQMEKS